MHRHHPLPAAAGVSLPHLPLMTWRDQPVATSDMLARCYGTDQRRIRKNFERNRERFVEGKHVFRVEGAALAEFRERLKDALEIAPNVRVLNLWTERGAARHAKMLDTDQAWDIFEALEDSYFRRAAPPASMPAQAIETAREVGRLKDAVAARDKSILKLYQRLDAAQRGHIRAAGQLLGAEKRLRARERIDTAIRMEAAGIPRDEIVRATGMSFGLLRAHIFRARRDGRLPRETSAQLDLGLEGGAA